MHEPILHFLLPFALPPAAQGGAVLSARATPGLDKIVRYAALRERIVGEDFQRSLSHEHWLATCYGIAAAHTDDDVPLAPYMMLADGVTPGDARWACVQPVHVQVAHDHLMLIDPETLELEAPEAEMLLVEARKSVSALGMTLLAPSPRRWYLSGDALGVLMGASPLRAAGRSIDIWLPHEAAPPRPRSRSWMKLQNEIQMAWHEHPANQAREARRELPVNSVWLHGQGTLAKVKQPFGAVFSDACATRGLAIAADTPAALLPESLADLMAASVLARERATGATAKETPGTAGTKGTARAAAATVAPLAPFGIPNASKGSGPTLIELGSLASPFLTQDWGGWLARLADIETAWLTPALQSLEQGDLGEIRLTLCSDTGCVTLSLRRFDLKKFWRRRTLLSLLTN